MCKGQLPGGILIFAGTTEGRLLGDFCGQRGIAAFVSVATGYGAQLLPSAPCLSVLVGRMDSAGMEGLLRARDIGLVVDATHPFAKEASRNIQAACRRAGRDYVRVLRETVPRAEGRYFSGMEALVGALSGTEGDIFITTGSKTLGEFCRLPEYAERCTVRVLPGMAERCLALGFRREKIIAAQGPFSAEENLRHLGTAAFLVTKESGRAGGFAEKAWAARQAGAQLLVLERPQEEGVTVEQAKLLLAEYAGRASQTGAG